MEKTVKHRGDISRTKDGSPVFIILRWSRRSICSDQIKKNTITRKLNILRLDNTCRGIRNSLIYMATNKDQSIIL
jgi:hypothetical protein